MVSDLILLALAYSYSKPITMKNSIYPAIFSTHNAKEILEYYTTIFPESHLLEENSVVASASICNVKFIAINGGSKELNGSISFMVCCESAEEVDYLFSKLVSKGSILMPIDSYPFSERYAWVIDQFGIHWQLYLGKSEDAIGQKIVPTLLFGYTQQGNCQKAIDFYNSVFKNFKSQGVLNYTEVALRDQIQHTQFEINDFEIAAMDSAVPQDYTFNEATSFVLNCANQSEIDYYWNAFTAQGKEINCGWCVDPFGVSWQIVPYNLSTILSQNKHASQALLRMKKIQISDLENA